MSNLRKKKKFIRVAAPKPRNKQKQFSGEDLVGKLLVSAFGSMIAGALSLAQDRQINWVWVIVVFFALLFITIVYQHWKK